MYTIAYKWRLTTNKYAYITSTAYDSSNPNYRLSYISEKLPDITEDNIKNIVKRMSADEYRQCFEFMQQIIAEDNDGKYIKLKNWGYYYHFENDENGDNKILFVDAIASASVSKDNDAHVEVINNDGVLAFHFEIPRGEKGIDGIDGENGLNGIPMNDGKFSESIYKLTKNNEIPTPTLPPDWEVKGSDYQKNDYLPNGWSDTPCGISTTHKYEWVSTRKYNTVNGLWGRFSTGALMSKWGEDGRDGDGTEYIYKRTKTGEKPNITLPDNWESEDSEYQTNDEFAKVSFLTDQGWYDAPLGVSDEYHFEWVSFRKHKDGKWGAFSEPALWGTMGKDGNDIEYIFYLNNDNEPPVFDDGTNNPDIKEFQVNGYKPKTDNKIWLDNYQDPTYDNRFLWMSSRKKINDVWGAFNTGVTLFNIYRLGGKAYVDLYTRSNTRLTSTSLPSYGNEDIYYNFNTDSFYSGGTGYNNIITTIPGNNNVIWSTDIPEDNTPKMLFKTSALVEIKNNFDEYIPITSSMWYGPYIVSTNGENAIVQTPLVVFDDDSLSLPVREETNKPHERYKYSFNANLYYGDIKLLIDDYVVSGSSSENIINIEKSIDIDGEKLNIQFEINNSNEFTSIEYIYITLKGKYEGKDIVAEGQFKIIPFYSKDAVLYKILLNQDAIFIPSNPNKDGTIWSTVLTAQVVDNNGTEITISSDSENGLFYKNKDNVFINMPEGGLTLIASASTENNEQIAITNLPNPLNIIYKVNGTTREIEYVNFVNMPLNGAKGDKGDNAYHVELSNDMDQIYVTDDVIIYPQTVMTTISLFNGDEKALLDEGYISISNCDIFENTGTTNVITTGDTTDVIVSLTTRTGVIITGKTIDVNITISGEPYGKSYNFIKTFKLNVLHGTKDYDLDVSPTFIKKNKNKQYSESAITVNITERDITTHSKVVTTLTSFTEGLSITYFYNNDSDRQNDLETIGNKISVANVEGYNDGINKITINLYKQEELIDQVFVECVSDGIDGTDGSAYHIELTNEYEQLYVTDNVVVVSGLVETNYSLFNGIVDANDDISKFSVNIGDRIYEIENYDVNYTGETRSGITINPKNKKVSIEFNTGQTINERDIKAKFSIKTKNGVSIEKTLKIIVLNGTKDYDLVVLPTYLKLDKYGKLANSSITVSVSERDITTTNSTIKLLESLPDNIKVKYSIKNYGEQLSSDDLEYTSTNVINVTNNIEYAIIELLSGDTNLDYIKIETLKDGTDGIDGLSQIVDLSNDYDQLYVTDGVVVENQTIDTTVYLTNGLEKFDINTSDIKKISLEGVGIIDNIGKDKDDKGVKLIFNFDSGVTYDENVLVYTIEIEYNGNTFKKTFKIIILNGTKDYDLDINPTIVRKDKYGNYSPSSLTLNVIESNISTTNRNTEKIDSLPENYNLQCFVDNVIKDIDYTLGSEINFDDLKPNSYVRFELNSGNTLVDYAIVECVSDGIDGTDGSAYHIELSNEFDQVYTINNKILPGQTGITTTVQLFNGTQKSDITNLTITNFDGISTTGINENVVSISFNEGVEASEKEYIYTISGKTPEGDNVEKDFKVIVLNGNKDYDLHSTHTYVKKYGNNIIDTSITITVLESIISTNDRSKKTLNSLPERMGIEVFVDGNIQSNIVYNSGITLNLENLDPQQKIEVKLSYEGKHIDYIAIEVIKDGVNGKDGTSPYYIELSNDYDQILTTNNKVVTNQAIETTLSIYCGNEIITANSENIECRYENKDLFTVSTGNSEDNKHFTYIISAVTNAELEQNKTYDFEFIVNSGATNLNYDINKKFKVITINGTIDYDLDVTPTLLKKTVNGDYSNTGITIVVKETNISRTDRQINILNELPDQLSVECYINENKIEHDYSNGITISSQDFPDNGNIYVKLLKSGNTIDEVTVEIVSDGNNGESPIHVELSNDMEQIYTIDDVVNITQTASTIITVYSGGTQINNFKVGNNNITNGEYNYIKVYDSGYSFDDNEEKIEIKIDVNGIDITRYFKVIKFNGTKDYDLNVTPTFIKRDKNDKLSPSSITISINESEISSTNREIKQTSGVPSGYELTISKDGGNYSELTHVDTLTSINITDVNNYCTINLIKESKIIDSVTVEILKDGKKGDTGQRGKLLYPAGRWDSGTTYNGADTEKTPFVTYKVGDEDKYFVLTATTEISGTTYEPNISGWTEMAQYEALYTKLLVAENGLIGGSVYNGDYIFSQYGSNTGETPYSGFNKTDIDGFFESGFTDDLKSRIETGGTFMPTYLIDTQRGCALFGQGTTFINEEGDIYANRLVNNIQEYVFDLSGLSSSSRAMQQNVGVGGGNNGSTIGGGMSATQIPGYIDLEFQVAPIWKTRDYTVSVTYDDLVKRPVTGTRNPTTGGGNTGVDNTKSESITASTITIIDLNSIVEFKDVENCYKGALTGVPIDIGFNFAYQSIAVLGRWTEGKIVIINNTDKKIPKINIACFNDSNSEIIDFALSSGEAKELRYYFKFETVNNIEGTKYYYYKGQIKYAGYGKKGIYPIEKDINVRIGYNFTQFNTSLQKSTYEPYYYTGLIRNVDGIINMDIGHNSPTSV